MKLFSFRPPPAARRLPLALANVADPVLHFETLQNDATAMDDDGWALIAPFGRHPKTRTYAENGQAKSQKFIQVLDNESADEMVGSENTLFRKLKRALVGIPVFKGHGDLKEHDPKALANDEKIKLGVVDKIRKSGRGIEAHFNLDNDGAEAVQAGWKLPSALWLVQPIGNEGDSILARPFKLLSVALTQFPNISGVESLANQATAKTDPNEKPTNQPPTHMALKDNLIGLLLGRGTKLPDNATDEQVFAALANDEYDSGCSHNPAAIAKKAFQASAKADDAQTHITASAGHLAAADAYGEGDQEANGDFSAIHAQIAKFHTLQAAKLKK
ncbi:MAG: phage protease [Verrucomicrobiota bacterium]|jgi:hypothetical protein